MRKLLPCLLLMLGALPVLAARDVYSARYEERGRLLVEMRPIFEALSATVEWIPNRQQIHARRGDSDMLMRIDSPQAWVNGKAVALEVPPRLVDNTTRVPLRFVAQSFGATVQYNGGSVRIVTPDQDVLTVHLGAGFMSGEHTGTIYADPGNVATTVTPPGRAVVGAWPWTARRSAQPADLAGHTNWELTLMRMEIKARYGQTFVADAIRAYFTAQPWYAPSSGFNESMLTTLERRNYKAIWDFQVVEFGKPADKP